MSNENAFGKKEAVDGINAVLAYCKTFRDDNIARETAIEVGALIDEMSVDELRKFKIQLDNHYSQRDNIEMIESLAQLIERLLDKVTYRSKD